MPRLSDSMVDGTIVSWLHADGDELNVGDEIVEIETDKAIMPYQAEHAGTLRIVARDGEVIAVGALIAHIGEPDPVDEAAGARAGGTESPASSAAQSGSVGAPSPPATVAPTAPPASQRAAGGSGNGRVKASPVARRLAAARGVELATLAGTGPGGRIVKRDVQNATPAAAARLGTGDMGAVERRPLTATQATIARRMVEAKAGAPDFTVTVTVDMEAAVDLRAQLRDAGVEPLPSLGDFVISACAGALREHPQVNASYAGDAIELHGRVNVGVAVAAGAGASGGTQ
ncbi:MAG: 2-oxo acid dehydrogenase subunit E2, partial [Solirubrobacteraceae bacterium]